MVSSSQIKGYGGEGSILPFGLGLGTQEVEKLFSQFSVSVKFVVRRVRLGSYFRLPEAPSPVL